MRRRRPYSNGVSSARGTGHVHSLGAYMLPTTFGVCCIAGLLLLIGILSISQVRDFSTVVGWGSPKHLLIRKAPIGRTSQVLDSQDAGKHVHTQMAGSVDSSFPAAKKVAADRYISEEFSVAKSSGGSVDRGTIVAKGVSTAA